MLPQTTLAAIVTSGRARPLSWLSLYSQSVEALICFSYNAMSVLYQSHTGPFSYIHIYIYYIS